MLTYTFDTNLLFYERRYKDKESSQNHPDSIRLSTRRRYCLSTLWRQTGRCRHDFDTVPVFLVAVSTACRRSVAIQPVSDIALNP